MKIEFDIKNIQVLLTKGSDIISFTLGNMESTYPVMKSHGVLELKTKHDYGLTWLRNANIPIDEVEVIDIR